MPVPGNNWSLSSLTPRARTGLAVLFLCLLPPLFFWRETLGWLTLGDKDLVFWFYPAYKFVAEQIRTGSFPLWNPYQYGGIPLFAEWQAGVLDPLNWLYLISSSSRALTASLQLSFALALLAAFSYARSLGFARRASVISAVVYAFSGFAVARVLYPGFLHILALTPLVLCFTEHLHQRGRWREVIGGALIIAWQLFAAHPQPVVYSSVLASAYAIFYACEPNTETLVRSFRQRLEFLLKFGVMFLAGAGLAAVQLLPAAEFARQSVRQDWPFELFTLHSLHPVSLLVTLFPFGHGEGHGWYQMRYWGVYWHHNEAQIYLGALAMTLALGGALLAWRRRFRVGKFWSIVAVVGVVFSLGKYAGPVATALYYFPLFNHFRSPNRHWLEVVLAVAVLAGYAVDRLGQERSADERCLTRNLQWTAVSLLLFSLCVGGLVLWQPDRVEQWLRQVMELSAWPAGFLRTASAEFWVPMIVAAVACVMVLAVTQVRNRAPWLGVLLLVLLLDYQLYAVCAPINTPDKLESLIGQAVPPALAAQQRETAPFRYHIMLNATSGEFSPFWFYGHEMASGYDPLLSERYKTFSGTDEAGRAFISTLLEPQDHTLDLLNVRYVFAPLVENAAAQTRPAAAQLRQGQRVVYATGSDAADSLLIVSNLSNAAELPADAEVAQVTVQCASGVRWTAPLRAGRETAEWAYDRADVRAAIKHTRPAIAESWPGDDAASFQAHTYMGRLSFPPELVACRAPRTIEIKSVSTGEISLDIKRVALADRVTGRAVNLSQAATDALSDVTRWRELSERSPAKAYQEYRIFENLRALPRVWLVNRVQPHFDGDQLKTIRGELAGQSFDPRTTALVDHETATQLDPQLRSSTDAESQTGSATILQRSPTRLVVETDAVRPSLLVASDAFASGWQATVDGVAADVWRVNYDLRGVQVAAGKHRVEFRYLPGSLKAGAVVSLTTALGLVLLWFWEARRRRVTGAGVRA